MKVFALGGPQGNTGQKSVLVKKPVSRKFIVLSSLEILFFFTGSLLHTLLLLIMYLFIYFIFVVFVFGRIPWFIRVGLECIIIVYEL